MRIFPARHARATGPSERAADVPAHVPCVIVGAGHAGLSVAYGLQQAGLRPLLLEQLPQVGDVWRRRYQRLHLHHLTDAMYLPGMHHGAQVPEYPSRLDFADYLQAYVLLHQMDVRLGHRLHRLTPLDTGGWELQVSVNHTTLTFTADHVVLATGPTGVTPLRPALKGQEHWRGQILHSVDFDSGADYRGQRVLVVGAGNSAIEVLCDLYDNSAEPSLLMRSPGSWVTRQGFAHYHRLLAVGRWLLTYVPGAWLLAPVVLRLLDHYLKYDVRRRYPDLAALGVDTHPATPMLRMAQSRGTRPPTYIDGTWGKVGVTLAELLRAGTVALYRGEIEQLQTDSRSVAFTDGRVGDFDTIILCTGFAPPTEHWQTFLDSQVSQAIAREMPLPWAEHAQFPGLWVALGGVATSRFALQILARRLAARILGHRPPGRVLNPVVSFLLSGIDPGLIQIPRRTLVINTLAACALTYLLWL